MKHDVETLATPSGRMVGTTGHEAARDYLISRMTELGLEGYQEDSFALPYTMHGINFINLLGRISGHNPTLAPMILVAHYDTAGELPGADDNAAAIAILLSLVKRFMDAKLERSILIAFFDAEEPPYSHDASMGSIYFYEHQRQEDIHCALVLDLVGHDIPLTGLEDLLFITGMESDPKLPKALKAQTAQGIRPVMALNRYVGDMSDHRIFRLNQRPYLFFSCGRWEHYHMPSDTPEKLNYDKMLSIANYLFDVTLGLSKTPLEGPFEGYDSTPDELYFMQQAIGDLAKGYGLELKSRQDIDMVVSIFMEQFKL